MHLDPDNHVIKLCAKGMDMEGTPEEASKLFTQAWNEAVDDFERFIAAHYIARHQNSIADKLKWDETALHLALKIKDKDVDGAYPSLYLNIAKCYEDLGDVENAEKNYQSALAFMDRLSDDGYGNMIKGGILNGIKRLKLWTENK